MHDLTYSYLKFCTHLNYLISNKNKLMSINLFEMDFLKPITFCPGAHIADFVNNILWLFVTGKKRYLLYIYTVVD